jgi:hypothetical protein
MALILRRGWQADAKAQEALNPSKKALVPRMFHFEIGGGKRISQHLSKFHRDWLRLLDSSHRGGIQDRSRIEGAFSFGQSTCPSKRPECSIPCGAVVVADFGVKGLRLFLG